jgi:hypothetical protein
MAYPCANSSLSRYPTKSGGQVPADLLTPLGCHWWLAAHNKQPLRPGCLWGAHPGPRACQPQLRAQASKLDMPLEGPRRSPLAAEGWRFRLVVPKLVAPWSLRGPMTGRLVSPEHTLALLWRMASFRVSLLGGLGRWGAALTVVPFVGQNRGGSLPTRCGTLEIARRSRGHLIGRNTLSPRMCLRWPLEALTL